MTETTQTGIPVTECTQCNHTHPITRSHCAGCGHASAFVNPTTGYCLNCGSDD